MYCIHCGATIRETSKFCNKCGKSNSSIKKSAVPDTENIMRVSSAAPSDPATVRPGSIGLLQQEPIEQSGKPDANRSKSRFRRVLPVAVSCVIAVLLIGTAVVFAFQLKAKKDAGSIGSSDSRITSAEGTVTSADDHGKDQNGTSDETTVSGKVSFLQDKIQFSVGDSADLNNFLTTNIDAEELIWSSDKPDQVSVDSTGRIQVLTAGASAAITVKNSSNPVLSATISVNSLTVEAQDFVKEIAAMNNVQSMAAQIDVHAANYQPAARDKSLKWDKSLFYSLEDVDKTKTTDGLIINYTVEKKQLTNSVNGNLIEYEIYKNPNTGCINKITSIEHMPDTTLKIAEYYYTDSGRINFIFVREDTIYTPTYASPDKKGERFYFAGDVMVKWRIVDSAQVLIDYAIGVNEQHNTTTSADAKLYDNESSILKSQYDAIEIAMINAAYNTMCVVIETKTNGSITGLVTDASGTAVPDSKVILSSTDYNAVLIETKTGQDGSYRFYVPSVVHSYQISIIKGGFVPETLYQIEMSAQTIESFQESIRLAVNDGTSHNIKVLVTDALNSSDQAYNDGYDTGMKRLASATVHLRTGINNRTGTIYSTVQTGSDGIAAADLPSGNYTAEIITPGYAASFGTIVANADGAAARISTTPVLSSDEIRIVLTWGTEPADLDSHLFTPYNEADSNTNYHIWFTNMSDASGNRLDVDDTNSNGPETITISSLNVGSYKYYVADYTNCSQGNTTSTAMSNSNAKVSVYTKDGLVATFYVPSNQSGVIWEVFEIRNKTIVPIQRYYTNIDDKPWWSTDK